jgi:hypothetical protein
VRWERARPDSAVEVRELERWGREVWLADAFLAAPATVDGDATSVADGAASALRAAMRSETTVTGTAEMPRTVAQMPWPVASPRRIVAEGRSVELRSQMDWRCTMGASDEEARELWHVAVDTVESGGFVRVVEPRLASPSPHDPQLAQAARRDPSAARVYADWLLERGDGRGEWLAADQALSDGEVSAITLVARGRSFAERRLRERAALPPHLVSFRWRRGFLDEVVLLDVSHAATQASLWADPLVDGLRVLSVAELVASASSRPVELPSESLAHLEELNLRAERLRLAPLELPRLRHLALGGGAALHNLGAAAESKLPSLRELDLVVGGVDDIAEVVSLVRALPQLDIVRVDEPRLMSPLASLGLRVELR